jgi:hypothetical protein
MFTLASTRSFFRRYNNNNNNNNICSLQGFRPRLTVSVPSTVEKSFGGSPLAMVFSSLSLSLALQPSVGYGLLVHEVS